MYFFFFLEKVLHFFRLLVTHLGDTWKHFNWRTRRQFLSIFREEIRSIGRIKTFLINSPLLTFTHVHICYPPCWIPFFLHITGSTTTLAPFLAASKTWARALARLACLSAEPPSWIKASLNLDAGARMDWVMKRYCVWKGRLVRERKLCRNVEEKSIIWILPEPSALKLKDVFRTQKRNVFPDQTKSIIWICIYFLTYYPTRKIAKI